MNIKIFKTVARSIAVVLIAGVFASGYSYNFSNCPQQINKTATTSDVTLALHCSSPQKIMNQ